MPAYTQQALSFGPFTLHRSERLLVEGGREVRLGVRTMDLLVALVERSGEVVSPQALIAYVWGHQGVELTTLRAQVASLRAVLGKTQQGQRYIVNVVGRGYCFVAAVRPQSCPAPSTAEGPRPAPAPRNLPARLTRMVGREPVVHTIAHLMAEKRFVCLAGPGGVGKTTVAIAVGDLLLPRYCHRVRFVDLAGIEEAGEVAAAVAGALNALDATAPGIHPLSRLGSDPCSLLILDHCEHVASAAADAVGSLLKAAPGVRVLATCREPLRAEGAWVHRLSPLDLPPAGSPLTAEVALSFSAVQLFVERSMASDDRFVLRAGDAERAADICRRLEGLPLAIERAAGRVGTLGIRGLMERLQALPPPTPE